MQARLGRFVAEWCSWHLLTPGPEANLPVQLEIACDEFPNLIGVGEKCFIRLLGADILPPVEHDLLREMKLSGHSSQKLRKPLLKPDDVYPGEVGDRLFHEAFGL